MKVFSYLKELAVGDSSFPTAGASSYVSLLIFMTIMVNDLSSIVDTVVSVDFV